MAQAYACEEVDSKACIVNSVTRKDTMHVLLDLFLLIFEALGELRHAQVLCHLLEQYLNEYATRRCGFFLCEADACHATPLNTIGVQQMREQCGTVSYLVDFVPVHLLELHNEYLIEMELVDFSHLAEPLRQMPVEAGEGFLL